MNETAPPQKFHNPYDVVDVNNEHKRVHTEVTREDYLLVKLIRPDQGTIKNVIGLLWKQLCYELRTRNITDNTSSAEFESFLSNCRIVPADEYDRLLHSASGVDSGRDAETNGGDDRSGTARVPAKRANRPPKRTNLPSDGGVKG